jgi:hypothetical protein
MNYNWTVTNLYTLDEGTETDYVVTALYNVIGIETVDGTEYTASLSNSAQFEVVEGATFIPYADLTNTIVIGWIENQLGEDGVNNIQACISGMINTKINPSINPQNTELPTNFN